MVRLNIIRELKPSIAMILSQVATGGVTIFYKLAVADGMQIKILIFYRLAVATIFVLPLALFLERKSRPKFTHTIAIQGLACGLFGSTLGSSLYAESMVLTSGTFAAAISNIIPALTLLLAIIFRLERLNVRKSAGKAKILGTALGITGAMILTLYKGKIITLWSTHVNVLHKFETATTPKVRQNQFLGTLLAMCSCISYAAWLIVQTKISQTYPLYSSTVLMCFTGAIMTGVYALARETRWTEWKLGWNIRLLSVAYTGIIGSGVFISLTAWGTKVRGPLYVSSFSPLALIFIAVLSSLTLDEKLYLGSIIGSVLIIVGLYIVLWGKYKEMKMDPSCSNGTEERSLEITSADRNHIAMYTVAPKHDDHIREDTSPKAAEEV